MILETSDLAGRFALVTGGTGGIGQAIANALAWEGCHVTVTGRTRAEAAAFHRSRPDIDAAALDVTQLEAVRKLAARFDRLDILVNCAGMILRNHREYTERDFVKVIDANLNGTMRSCFACRPLLAKQKGCIVNLASMLSFFGSGFVPAYSASKGGVAQLTKSLAIEWAEEGVRVNAIAPGWIKTAMTQPLVDNPARSRAIVERTPMKRWGTPEDVAGAAVFLCSPQSSFITGVILPVDGGYSCA